MSRVMAAQLFLLNREDIRWRTDGERIYGSPVEALDPITLNMARDLKPELIGLLGFTEEQREIILRLDPQVDLVGLARYRKGLDLWDRFTSQEQALLEGHPWGLNDLQNINQLLCGWWPGVLESVECESERIQDEDRLGGRRIGD